jgi:hypothetical protein
MDHDEVIEQLELAAVEPDGLTRLMAGDTAVAAAVAGHLAGCDRCAGEFQRLSRAAPLLRDVVRTTPSADLRERTLAFVREHGVPRGEAVVASTAAGAAAIAPQPAPVPLTAARSRTARALPWVASIAAAVVLSVVATVVIVDRRVSDQLAAQDRAIAGLEAVTTATFEITAQPDVERVTLASTDAATESYGSLLFSPSTQDLVVVATGLERPPQGREYRCWVELDGKRESVGRMFFAEDLAYWVGDTPAIGAAGPGTTFGVSLTDVGSASVDAPPVLSGEL